MSKRLDNLRSRASPWSIFLVEPVAALPVGIVVTVYAAVFLTLLLRDAWDPIPDLLSFALYVGIVLTGLANVVRALGAVSLAAVQRIGLAYALVAAGWALLLLRHSTPLVDWEGITYAATAAAGLAALISEERQWALSHPRAELPARWRTLPALALTIWALLEMNTLPGAADLGGILLMVAGLLVLVVPLLRGPGR